MLEEVKSLIERGASFAFESTLSGKTYLALPQNLWAGKIAGPH